MAVCLNISTVINIKILTNSNQQTQSYKYTSHIAAFLSVVLITEMLEICIQTSYDQNVQLILKSYLPVVYGTILNDNLSLTQNAMQARNLWKQTEILYSKWPYTSTYMKLRLWRLYILKIIIILFCGLNSDQFTLFFLPIWDWFVTHSGNVYFSCLFQ